MSGTETVAVALFTRDLRVHDNPVLAGAAAHDRVVPLFVLDPGILHRTPANGAAFLVDSLADLDAALRERGARLVIRRGDVVEQVCRVARETGARQVHLAADVSGYAQRRRVRLDDALTAEGRELVVHDTVVTAVSPGAITPAGRDHFAVFTPYYRRWLGYPKRCPLPAPRRLPGPAVSGDALPTVRDLAAAPPSPELVAGGERAGRARLAAWTRAVARYGEDGDLLAADATSRLSPYLHFGCLSATELIARFGDSPGGQAFVRQLAWREFHHQVLAARPCSAREDYRPRGDRWRRDPQAFADWQAGRTGYPIVDAGMRQLTAEGWMHNRARLIVASFLTKTLYLDWRLGARHFWELLVDGDVANNQMNWQWIAGTGTDTRPNRVLNPLAQAHRYDPHGDYVRRYLPELARIPGSDVHEPWQLDPARRRGLDYPDPIADLDEGRRRLLAARGKG